MKKRVGNNMETLVRKAIKGNDDAFSEIVKIKSEAIIFSALRILRQRQDAEDAAQEVVIKMYKYIGRLKDPAAFNAWMQRIIINQCYSIQKKQSEKKEMTGMEDKFENIEEKDREFLPQGYAESKEQRLVIREIIERLPEQRQMMVQMYYYDDMSYKEIAYALETTVGIVASNLSRAKDFIKSELEKNGGISDTTINKNSAMPVLSVVLLEQAQEQVPHAAVQNIVSFTENSVLGKVAVAKAQGIFSWKVISTIIVCTVIATGGIVYAIGNANNGLIKDTQSANIATSDGITTGKQSVGDIAFECTDCECGHANPKKITLVDTEGDYEDVSWTITNKNTNQTTSGSGDTITTQLADFFDNKQDGDYTVSFIVKYSHGELKVERDFIVNTGEIQPGEYS